jgi:hypothetical protein
MKRTGFALVELVVLVNVAALCAVMAVPTPPPPQAGANESKAILVLRDLVQKQARFKNARYMDEDQDGRGEYGSFGELSGLSFLLRNGIGVAAPLNPPLLPLPFQTISMAGHVALSGYHFVVFLPDAAFSGRHDVANGGPDPNIDPDKCETVWCAYAWPTSAGTTGNRAFFVNQQGKILQTSMAVTQYSGPNLAPAYPAAFLAASMAAPIAFPAAVGVDGNTWTLVP